MDNLNIDKFNYRIKARILIDNENLKLEDKGLSWLYSKDLNLIIKTINKYNNKYTISFKNNSTDILKIIKEKKPKVLIGCSNENIFIRIELEDIIANSLNQSLDLILDEKFDIDNNKSHIKAKIVSKENININFYSWINFNDENKRIESLATKDRLNGDSGKFKTKEFFLDWYNKEKKICCYCGVKETDLVKYFNQENKQYKEARQRGRFLEIERIVTAPKEKNIYSEDNCALACYICNNAKSDFLSPESFKPVAKGINEFWNNLLGLGNVFFPEDSEIWKKK